MTPVPCVGAVVQDDAGRLLLVRRAHDPARGRWSVPGGRVEPGEDDTAAVVREVAEETGLQVRCEELLGRVEIPTSADVVFDVADYRCRVVGGALLAGDDALDAGWFTAAELAAMPLIDGLLDTFAGWGVVIA